MPTLRSRILLVATEKSEVLQLLMIPSTWQPTRDCSLGSARPVKEPPVKHLKATRASARESPMLKFMKTLDGCLTDPEPGMDSRRATVRNMRSKCRCSCVLQFTFRRAVSCVLHRPPSQVIHCTVLYTCLLYTSPSPRDQRGSRMPSSA